MKHYSLLVNRTHPLPNGYEPNDLCEPDIPFEAPQDHPRRLLRRECAAAAEQLWAESRRFGLKLRGISGYRSYERQSEIYQDSLERRGQEYTNRYIALPGTSEHQTGLALDISCPAVNFELETSFALTDEGIWLAKYAPLYGFILRYPEDKEAITGIAYEPWHIRYVTRALALYLGITGMTLEEYDVLQCRQ